MYTQDPPVRNLANGKDGDEFSISRAHQSIQCMHVFVEMYFKTLKEFAS